MDRNEKKKLRESIGERLDVRDARLSDDDALFLAGFLENYDDKWKGQSGTRRSSSKGWSSDGRYTRTEDYTYTFTDDVGIREDRRYHDDDGTSGEWSREIKNARAILDWFKNRG